MAANLKKILVWGIIIVGLCSCGLVFYFTQTHSSSPQNSSTPSAFLSPSLPLTPQPSPTSTSTPTPTITPSSSPSLAPTPTPKITPTPIPIPLPIPASGKYTVVLGDTLSAIARKFGLSLNTLESYNPQISNPNLIYPGQVINLKATSPSPSPITPPVPLTKSALFYRIPTTKPVVFLTIDDGITKVPGIATLMQRDHLVASFFLTYSLVQENPTYFINLRNQTGSMIEGHTYTHQDLITLSYADQKTEISKGLDGLQQLFGRRPTLVRPPYGSFNDTTRRAAAALGINTLILWDVTVNQGTIAYAYGDHLRPGDIVLMHFRPTLEEDIEAFTQAMNKQGLHTELLENWIK